MISGVTSPPDFQQFRKISIFTPVKNALKIAFGNTFLLLPWCQFLKPYF